MGRNPDIMHELGQRLWLKVTRGLRDEVKFGLWRDEHPGA
jgi:hypothetical protein